MVASAADIDAAGVPSASPDEDDEEGAMMLQMLIGGEGEAREAVLKSNFLEEWDTDMRVHLARCESGSAMDFFFALFCWACLICI